MNFNLNSGFSGFGSIPIGGITLFLFDFSKLVNTRGIRENNRRDLVIKYCKILDTDFSILQESNVNFSYLQDIRELWDGEVIILPGKTQTCGVLVLAKRTIPPV